MAEAEVKTIIEDFVLIVYDIPAKEEKARKAFLREARAIGAVESTQSCYLMPFSDKSYALANELAAKGGDVIIWHSYQDNKKKAIEITEKYEKAIAVRCDEISQRLVIAQSYMVKGQLGMAARVGIKSANLIKQLLKISQHFNPPWLKSRLDELGETWKEIYGAKEEQ